MRDPYRFLGIAPNASDEAILAAYLAKVQGADPATVAQADTALGVLTDPGQRAAYNQARSARASGPPGRPTSGPQPVAPPPSSPLPNRPVRPPAASRPANGTAPRRPPGARPVPPARQIPRAVPAVVGLVGLLGFVLLALLLNKPTLGPPAGGTGVAPAARLAAQAVEAPLVNGVQTLDVRLNGDTFHYEPSVIKVKQGLPVHFNLSTKGDPG